ncbi:MAG: UPF0179 family protein [Candidatus Bathyarchaeia archaeon]
MNSLNIREKGVLSNNVKERLITLIGIRQARVGFQFIFNDPGEECASCKQRSVCLDSLEVGRVYRITRLRERSFPCKIHADGVSVVEVVESDVYAAIPKNQAFEGATFTFKILDCDETNCKMRQICFPLGIFEGEKCKILKVDKNFSCPKDFPLVKALLQRMKYV